jgi:hypothetical protein
MRKALVCLLLVISAGCLNEDVVGDTTATGAYTLRTINDAPLPFTLSTVGTTKTEVLDAVLTLYQGGTYAETSHLRVTTNGVVTTQTKNDTGSYSFFNITVTLTSSAGNPERRGRIEATTMTITEEGKISIYRK